MSTVEFMGVLNHTCPESLGRIGGEAVWRTLKPGAGAASACSRLGVSAGVFGLAVLRLRDL